jgi:hypothetical protein
MTTASAVPNTTGMVEAGRAQGRPAMIHFFSIESVAGGAGLSIMSDL